jgi:hypothetical protein
VAEQEMVINQTTWTDSGFCDLQKPSQIVYKKSQQELFTLGEQSRQTFGNFLPNQIILYKDLTLLKRFINPVGKKKR